MNKSKKPTDVRARVLVVDDHPLLREGVAQLINRQADMVVCGEADSVAGAANAVRETQPDVILLDMRLGNEDALELVKSIKAAHPRVRVLVFSQHDEAIYAERALRAGAAGFVMKQEATEDVLVAIRAVLVGETYVSRKMAVLVLHRLLENTPSQRGAGIENLTDRELQVFQMLGAGLSSRAVAEQLHLSLKTVETYRENIKHKRGLRTAAELIRDATDWVRGTKPQPPRLY